MFKRTLLLVTLAVFAGPTDAAHAGGKNVAIIDNGGGSPLTEGERWHQFLTDHGYACTVFPKDGPTGPLDPFDVVIDMSVDWSDPSGALVNFMRAGKTVVTAKNAPYALGLTANPTVQAWMGANASAGGGDALVTVARDPILGDIPPGTEITNCADFPCGAVADTSGHPGAKVLARLEGGAGNVAIMRNIWEGGVSVYITHFVDPGTPLSEEIISNAVRARTLTIPTLNAWALLALGLAVGVAGAIVIRRRRSHWATISILFAVCVFAASPAARAEVGSTQEGGVTNLRLGDAEGFHSTDKTVANLRSVPIPDSPGLVVLWNETHANGPSEPFYAIALDGKNVNQVRATSYDLLLRYAGFDPATKEPSIPMALTADPDGQLYIVQFVTQPLSAFRRAVETQGATLHNFLPNHAYIARAPAQARAAVAALPFVRAVVPYHPGYKLEEFLRHNLERAEEFYPLRRYNVQIFEPRHKPMVAERIKALGGVVDSPDTGKHLLAATLTPAQLLQVARLDEVLFIDRWSEMTPDMNNVRAIGGANTIEFFTPGAYRGTGVRGEVFDIGFNTEHVDFASGDACLPSTRSPLIEHGGAVGTANHGASTSGIIFGNGSGNATAKGLLPCGQGIVAWTGNVALSGASRYRHTCQLVKSVCCPTNPVDPNCQEDPNSPYEAVFQSTSAGTADTTDYTTFSFDMDDMLFDFDLVHCQSQGNCGGTSESGDCRACGDSRCSRPQAWGKNTIAVGAVKHYNDANSFQYNSNDRWCNQYQEPSSCGVSWFSCASIGPAADGRIKPDLVGFYECIDTVGWPGTTDYATGNAAFAGTSAATPIVCGHVGLLMEMWADDSDNDGKNIFGVPVASCNPTVENCVFKRRPHASTAKAVLVNTARQYDWVNGPYANHDIGRFKQGWGFPGVQNLYDLRSKMMIINETCVLPQFGSLGVTVKVYAGEPALKATLVYKDPPGTTSSTMHRINDLNLYVAGPSRVNSYWGNRGLSSGVWSTSGGTADALNTVENVFVQNPEPGLWTVLVYASDVNQDGHVQTPGEPYDVDFAVVVSGVQPFGDCHFPGGAYFVTDRADCLAQSGTYDGDIVSCDPCPTCY